MANAVITFFFRSFWGCSALIILFHVFVNVHITFTVQLIWSTAICLKPSIISLARSSVAAPISLAFNCIVNKLGKLLAGELTVLQRWFAVGQVVLLDSWLQSTTDT